MADGGDQRDLAVERSAHDDLLVERPEVFDRAAAARDDQHVRPVRAGHGVEAAYAGGDLRGRLLALHESGPDDDAHGKALADSVEDVADDGAGGRGDDADDARHVGDRLLVFRIKQALGGELLLALFEQLHQRAGAGGAHGAGDQLIGRAALIGREAPRGDNFEAFFGTEGQALDLAAPHDRVEHGLVVFQVGIHVAGLGEGHPAQLAAHDDVVIVRLDRPLQAGGEFGDGEFGLVRGA